MGHGMLMQDVPKRMWPKPPTHFEVNKFTSPFQDLLTRTAFRDAKWPGAFYFSAFPFLFGVMYGDIGHGSILWGLYFLSSRNAQWKILKWTKWVNILLLMGAFAVYCGLIYNDFFALGLNLFGGTRMA